MRFEIIPHKGIGPVLLGMNRSEVITIMAGIGGGSPESRSDLTDCFFENSFQVSYNDQGKVEFIEIANDPQHEFILWDRDVFDQTAHETLSHIMQFDSADPELSEGENNFFFSSLILTLWDIDEQYDHKGGQKRPMVGAIGVGDQNYLSEIRNIKL